MKTTVDGRVAIRNVVGWLKSLNKKFTVDMTYEISYHNSLLCIEYIVLFKDNDAEQLLGDFSEIESR
jgi:hypothetical protein